MAEEKLSDYAASLKADCSPEELQKIYSSWSKTYEKDLVHGLKYKAPFIATKLLSGQLEKLGHGDDITIIDFGCGTGATGEELSKFGYKVIDGLDFCPSMLEIAREKGIYRSLIQGAMGSDDCKDLGLQMNQYHAALCVGVFTLGHVKGKGFDDLVYAVKPGGLVCFSIRETMVDDPQYGYQEKMNELCQTKKWKLVEKQRGRYHDDCPYGWFFVYQIL